MTRTPEELAITECFPDGPDDEDAFDAALQRYMATVQHDHVHEWQEIGPTQVRREGSKAAYVTVPSYWCTVCGCIRIDGKVTWPSRIVHPPPVLSEG